MPVPTLPRGHPQPLAPRGHPAATSLPAERRAARAPLMRAHKANTNEDKYLLEMHPR